MRTWALGMTAPEGSVTTPAMVPPTTWACAAMVKRTKNSAAIRVRVREGMRRKTCMGLLKRCEGRACRGLRRVAFMGKLNCEKVFWFSRGLAATTTATRFPGGLRLNGIGCADKEQISGCAWNDGQEENGNGRDKCDRGGGGEDGVSCHLMPPW